jgi:hypothetical protein
MMESSSQATETVKEFAKYIYLGLVKVMSDEDYSG